MFGHSRQYDEKEVKIEDEGACSPLYAEQVLQSVMNQSGVKRLCVLPGAERGTCTGLGDGLHGPAVLLRKYDQRNYFCGPKGNLKPLQWGGGEGTSANLYGSASKHWQIFSVYFSAFNTV